jgi:hypothetical protein
MDASIWERAAHLATEFAGQATTTEELNGLMQLMMKSALERMLDTEMDVHLGRTALPNVDATLDLSSTTDERHRWIANLRTAAMVVLARRYEAIWAN